MNREEISQTISKFIKKNFLYDENKTLDENASLYQSGVIDSMGTIELISFLESTYNIRFNDDELIAENFDSVNSISNFIYQKLNSISQL